MTSYQQFSMPSRLSRLSLESEREVLSGSMWEGRSTPSEMWRKVRRGSAVSFIGKCKIKYQ